jgi:hypothetical protein
MDKYLKELEEVAKGIKELADAAEDDDFSLDLTDAHSVTDDDDYSWMAKLFAEDVVGVAVTPVSSDYEDIFAERFRRELLIERYDMAKGEALIFPLDGSNPYPLNSYNGVKKDQLYLGTRLKRHVTGGDNFAMRFRKTVCKLISYDLDNKSGDPALKAKMEAEAVLLLDVIRSFGLYGFIYYSGSKGYHIEILFTNPVQRSSLEKVRDIILNAFIKRNGIRGFIDDAIYPSNRAYRIFGCEHYKTGKFTYVMKEKNIGNKVTLDELPYWDSWREFRDMPINDPAVVDKIIKGAPVAAVSAGTPAVTASRNTAKPAGKSQNHTPSELYTHANLEKLHKYGLFDNFTRHNVSYQLGRYFRYVLRLSKKQAENEIKNWIRKHFPDSCSVYGLTPFSAEACDKAKTPLEECFDDTVDNCIRGYMGGHSFAKGTEVIDYEKSKQYLGNFNYSRRKSGALLALLEAAVKLRSLVIGFDYPALFKIMKVGSKATVSKWMKEFDADGVLVRWKTGSGRQKMTNEYKFMLPADCYTIIN